MTSCDPRRCCEAVRSAILATAWLLVWIVVSLCIIQYCFISQVIGCEDCLQNDLDCVRWVIELYLNTPPPSALPCLLYTVLSSCFSFIHVHNSSCASMITEVFTVVCEGWSQRSSWTVFSYSYMWSPSSVTLPCYSCRRLRKLFPATPNRCPIFRWFLSSFKPVSLMISLIDVVLGRCDSCRLVWLCGLCVRCNDSFLNYSDSQKTTRNVWEFLHFVDFVSNNHTWQPLHYWYINPLTPTVAICVQL